ncbi:MAG: DUF2298 domain-containing protein [Candidatus Woesebacteria bacterium]|jgi:uncharacterized membrane protein
MVNDITYVFIWWFTLFVVGVVSIPTVWFVFKKFFDIGYGFAKIIGLLLVSYVSFVGATAKVIPFSTLTVFVIFFAYAIFNLFIFKKYKKGIMNSLEGRLKVVIFQEIFFTLGLVLWSYIRAHQPDIRGLEKFMDFGFINSILKSKYLPPADMWFAGLPINYYWFGHFFVAVVTKLSTIPSTVTYNLMLATILGTGLSGAFSIVSTLFNKLNRKKNIRLTFIAGVISAVLLIFAGNFHTPLYMYKEGKDNYWYPDATRFIGYHPETEDKTIHEFPIYSFVVSDLHAHLINLPLVLLYISLLLKYTIDEKDKENSTLSEILKDRDLIILGFIIGVMFMTNAWDFANYSLLSGIVFLVFNIKKHGAKLKAFTNTALNFAVILPTASLAVLPFVVNFESLAKGVKLVHTHTPLWQLLVLWGFPLILTVFFTTFLFKNRKSLKTPDYFVMSLFAASWTLIALPEIIYVKDIYIASHYRANTMFKLTYQAFVMFYLSSGYVMVRIFTAVDNLAVKFITGVLFALIAYSVLIYPPEAVDSYYQELKTYRGLRGDTWLKAFHPERYRVISWLKENVEGQPTILEAPGDSYTDFNVISSYTGLPTVSGWFVHEWLWRGDSSFPQKRVTDISQIYTSPDTNLTRNLLNKYSVSFIIVGSQEREKYPNLNEEKFNRIGRRVYSVENTSIYQVSD